MLFFMTIENEADCNKLTELYEAHSKVMYRVAYSIMRDHFAAEDVVQEAFIRLEKNIFKISQIRCNETRAFLVTIVRNLAINAYNDRKKLL